MQKLNYPSNGDEISPTGNCSQTPKVIWKITGVNDEDVSALYTINSGRLGDDNSSESPSNWLTGTATLCVSFSEAGLFLDKVFDMLEFLIPNYVKEGKYRLVVAIGCTGGKHRSVTLANALYERMNNHGSYGLTILHKDIKQIA